GELAIFRRVGLTPVFFASAVVGAAMPNLTYMLVFPDEAARAAAWTKFRGDSEWQKLRAIPEYADKEIVSRITNKVLTPTPYSRLGRGPGRKVAIEPDTPARITLPRWRVGLKGNPDRRECPSSGGFPCPGSGVSAPSRHCLRSPVSPSPGSPVRATWASLSRGPRGRSTRLPTSRESRSVTPR